MKKLLGILVLGLMLTGNAHAGVFKKSYEKIILIDILMIVVKIIFK